MSVWKVWLQLTRLVLAGRGRYEFNVFVHHPAPEIEIQANRVTLVPYCIDWIGGEDRYVTLAVEPEGGPS